MIACLFFFFYQKSPTLLREWIIFQPYVTSRQQLDIFLGLTHLGVMSWYSTQEQYLKDLITNSAQALTHPYGK